MEGGRQNAERVPKVRRTPLEDPFGRSRGEQNGLDGKGKRNRGDAEYAEKSHRIMNEARKAKIRHSMKKVRSPVRDGLLVETSPSLSMSKAP